MRLWNGMSLKYPVAKTPLGFKNFLKYTLLEVESIIVGFEKGYVIDLLKPNDYAIAKLIIEKYTKVESKFSYEEKAAVHYARYKNGNMAEPENFFVSFKSAYWKWRAVFFANGKPTLYKKIDYKVLGRFIWARRKANGFTRNAVALMCGINERTMEKYEKGVTPPSLEFLNYFAQIFDCSIDELIERSLKAH